MITSRSNEFIKIVRKLHDKKHRVQTGLAFIEGIKLIVDAVESHTVFEKVITSKSFIENPKNQEVLDLIAQNQIENVSLTDDVYQAISLKESPKGIGAVVRQKWLDFSNFTKFYEGLWLCLYQVADPGNLGTIIRTVDAVGGKGVILVGHCTDPYDPGAIRGSMGAIFSVQLVKTDLSNLVMCVFENKLKMYGTSDSAEEYYRDVHYPQNMILAMGSEREGLPDDLTRACEKMINLPMMGSADSLNLAVATGVVLYEFLHQNQNRG